MPLSRDENYEKRKTKRNSKRDEVKDSYGERGRDESSDDEPMTKESAIELRDKEGGPPKSSEIIKGIRSWQASFQNIAGREKDATAHLDGLSRGMIAYSVGVRQVVDQSY